ncbi:hypothetical protein CEXT_492181 [Caerostris extrusa]|uniref:Uncharacterized protein n=1 Tax=Caerostris extrusa TaxID=172846 RepID=A0AAV4NNY1_CAEEX|nr:hypothetical protein CEXT_492181 [Caerostris extrusa]
MDVAPSVPACCSLIKFNCLALTSHIIAQTSSPGLGHQSFDSRSMTTKWGGGGERESYSLKKEKKKNSLRKEGVVERAAKRRKPTGSEKIASCSRRSWASGVIKSYRTASIAARSCMRQSKFMAFTLGLCVVDCA